ncbi:MAG: cation:dicarboxylase symporter family transporter, partial [Verrucomicrobia bacterium]|nr:cation:dicarboxylase symporter family transporter [Cytophagales bacterium]
MKKLSNRNTLLAFFVLTLLLGLIAWFQLPLWLAIIGLTAFLGVFFLAPSLTYRIFLGMVIGIFIGHFFPATIGFGNFSFDTQQLKELGHIFLNLIKMIIAPLVFSTIVVGIAKLGDFNTVGRIGFKTIGYFIFASLLSLTLGMILVNLANPGGIMALELPPKGTETGIQGKLQTFSDFIDHIIPKSLVEAMAKNEILSILVFSIFFGVATASVGEQGKVIVKAMDAISHIMLKVTNFIMNFAPYGVLGSLAALVAKIGIAKLVQVYPYLIVVFYLGLAIFMFGVLFLICTLAKIPFFRLFNHVKEPFILAFSTASSESAMPKVIEGLEKFGCSSRIVSFVLPLGYSFNLDGSMMNMTFATMFIAQAYNIHISIEQQIFMMLILMVTSKGIAGVPRASLVVVAAILPTFNIPSEGLALLLGIDQILDMGRSATNVIGNAVATALVS